MTSPTKIRGQHINFYSQVTHGCHPQDRRAVFST
jgi:hypothetical protein